MPKPTNVLVLLGLFIASIVVGGCSGSGGTIIPPFNVTTLAGGPVSGAANGMGAAATFNNPVNVAIDSQGDLYICDYDNMLVRKCTPQGLVTTLTNQADFSKPFGIAFTPNGTLYVETDGNDLGQRDDTTGTIWSVDTATGVATVVARNLGRPRGLIALPDGRLVLVDLVAATVRLMNPQTGVITNLAGTAGVLGFKNGTGAAAEFSRPYGGTILPNGDILIADQNNNCLREITLGGVVTTYAGTGAVGAADGPRLSATFNAPEDVAIDSRGIVYVDDQTNHTIRRIAPDGTVATIAGGLPAGFKDGPGLTARFYGQEGIAVTPDGRTLYVADGTGGNDGEPYNRIRAVALY